MGGRRWRRDDDDVWDDDCDDDSGPGWVARCVLQARYRAYLRSPEWAEKRARIMERSGGTCERCRERPAVDVHHLTYDRIYHESPSDLQAVCRTCHDTYHGVLTPTDPWIMIVTGNPP
jgi:hypothetical protein